MEYFSEGKSDKIKARKSVKKQRRRRKVRQTPGGEDANAKSPAAE